MQKNNKAITVSKKSISKKFKKNSCAIQISGQIGLLGRQTWNVFLSYAKDIPKEQFFSDEKMFIPISTLYENLEYDTRNNAHLRDVLRKLVMTAVEWNLLEKDKQEEWEIMPLLSYAKISNGFCYFNFPRELKEKLYNPKMYALLNLAIQSRFTSKYSLILYELVFDYRRVGQTPPMKLDIFKKIMGAENTDRYNQFKFFNAEVIKLATSEVNKKTSLRLNVELLKDGKNVEGIKFAIKQIPEALSLFHVVTEMGFEKNLNNQPVNFTDEQIIEGEEEKFEAISFYDEVVGGLQKLKFSDNEIKKIKKDHDLKKIKNYLDLMKMEKNIKDPKGWFMSAITKNYDLSELEEKRRKEQSREEELVLEQKKRREEHEQQELKKEVKKKVDDWIKKSSENMAIFRKLVEEYDLPKYKEGSGNVMKTYFEKQLKTARATEPNLSEIDFIVRSEFFTTDARNIIKKEYLKD